MKKFFRIIMIFCVLCILSVLFVACASDTNDNNSGNAVDPNEYTHFVNINNETLFNYYFTFSTTYSFDSNYNFGTSSSSQYGTKSTSTITISPKLKGFVHYSGFVKLKAETENKNISKKVLETRKIKIEYWGTTTDTYDISNETKQNDNSISFNNVNYSFYDADIVITYHHEGLSGIKDLSYETISITKYNYSSYFTIKIENNSNRTTTYNETDIYHRNPIYTYHYYQTYTITPSSQIKGYKEFNNIVLTFDNGISVALDALGTATYKSQEYNEEQPIPKLSEIKGCIDFYPPAIYEY